MDAGALGRRRRRGGTGFDPLALYASGEAGLWADPSDLTPEKISWRRNLLTWSEQFDNSAWTKSNASILSNLLTWSQDFDNAAWTKAGSTISANVDVAPDGTTTADKIVEDTTGNAHRILAPTVGTSAGVAYTFSFFAKVSGRTHAYIRVNNSTSGDFIAGNVRLTDAVVTQTQLGTITATAVGNGWVRIVGTGTPSLAGTATAEIRSSNSDTYANYTGDGTSGILAWGAQLVPGTSAQTYTPTTSAIAPIQFTDPFGNATADKLVEDTATSTHWVGQAITTVVAPYTFSVFVKAAERTFALLYHNETVSGAIFNLSNGAITTPSGIALATASAVYAGNGWYRCSITVTATAASNSFRCYVANSSTTYNYAGNGANGILVACAQVERDATASSYQRITDFTSDFLAAFPTHALYQDSAGTTPVTALGQPVGLVLDKRLGGLANQGPQLVSNGDFSDGINGWTVSSNGLGSVVNGWGRIQNNGTVNRTLSQTILTVGRTYVVTGIARGDGSGGVPTLFSGSILWTGTSSTATQNIYTIFTATNTAFNLMASGGATGPFAEFDNISVREVPGSHAIQPTPTSRPTCDARVNLLERTEEFDNAYWTKSGANVTANAAVAPNGTTTVDRIVENTATSPHYTVRPVTFANVAYTSSVYVEKASTRNVLLYLYSAAGSAGAVLNVGTGVATVFAGSVAGTTVAVRDEGLFWLLSVTATMPANSGNVEIYMLNGTTVSYAGNGTSFIGIWGAELRLASDAALPYQRVVTASDYADVGAPRYLTFDGLDDSLYTAANVDFATWTSGTRRNLLTFPSAFDNAVWVKSAGSTVTANVDVAPDGTTTADRIVFTTAGQDVAQEPTLANNTYTGSYWVKAGLPSEVGKTIAIGVGSSFAGFTDVLITLTDSWQRITASRAITSGTTARIGVHTYAGATARNVLVWGAQLELGSTATAFQDVGTDKVSVFTGVRKLSDAATGILCEHTTTVATNNGSFYISAPEVGPQYGIRTKGTGNATGFNHETFAAPITNVISVNLDNSGSGGTAANCVQTRINGVANTANPSANTTTSSTFASAVFFVGRRNNSAAPFNGRLYQLLVRGAASDAVTVQQTERWVAQKTGVTL